MNTTIHRPRRQWRVMRALASNPMAITAAAILALIVLAAVFAPLLTDQDPNAASLRDALLPPLSPDHLLGTDTSGRDIWSRLLYGARVSLAGAALALIIAALIGIPSGLLAGYYGRWFDSASVWWNNVIQSMPGIVVLLAARAVLGPSIWISMLIFGVILSPGFYRVVRTSVINVRGELYVDAARVTGLSDPSIIGRHIMSVVRAPVIIQASLLLGVALAIQSGLEFLGVGDNTVPSWGVMLNEGFANVYRAPWMLLWPTIAIGLTCGCLVILGNGLRDALDDRRPPARARRGRSRNVTTPVAVEQQETSRDEAAPIFLEGSTTQDATEALLSNEAPEEIEPLRRDRSPSSPVRPPSPEALLSVRGLRVSYGQGADERVVVEDVNLDVAPGRVLGLVGESGSGKTQTAFSVLGLLPRGGRVSGGSIYFSGVDLTGFDASHMRAIRGSGIAYVPQEPLSNLDPSFRIGSQLSAPVRVKLGVGHAEAKRTVLRLLDRVGIPDPQRIYDAFPHEISGGMAQRALIAGAVSCKPQLLIADEPTTALDVTVQAEVLNLLRDLQAEYGMAMVLVTHNFGVVADICDRVAVMNAGRIVEEASVHDIFDRPKHLYTQKLLASTLDGAPTRDELDLQAGGPKR